MTKIGRNEPCPCGSGKKYKQCCLQKSLPGKRKIKATLLSQPKPVDLMERTYKDAVQEDSSDEQPPTPPPLNL